MYPASVAAIAMPRARMVFADQAPNQRCVLEGTLLQAGSSDPVSRPLRQTAPCPLSLRCPHGLMGNTVVVSDDAGQFRIPNHALCWVHAERLLQKLMPKTPQQARQLEKVRDQIWALYRDLKLWKQSPLAMDKPILAKRFDDLFTQPTRYKDLDQLMARLHRRKAELLKVLERPEIPSLRQVFINPSMTSRAWRPMKCLNPQTQLWGPSVNHAYPHRP
jgi:hypothetical protein